MVKRKGPLTPLKDVISNLLKGGDLPFNPEDAHIWEVWDDVVGDQISQSARPLWIKDGKLRVTVSDPIWIQELEFLEQDIRDKLNERLGRRAVEKMDFILNGLSKY